jgi:hypothetical protein
MAAEKIRTRRTKAFFDNTIVRVLDKVRDSMTGGLTIAQMGWVNAPRLKEAHDSTWRLYQAHDSRYTDFMWTGFAAIGVEVLLRGFLYEHATPTRILDQPQLEATGTCP